MSGPLNVLSESKMTDIFGVVSLMRQVNLSPEDAERLSAAIAALSDADMGASWLDYSLWKESVTRLTAIILSLLIGCVPWQTPLAPAWRLGTLSRTVGRRLYSSRPGLLRDGGGLIMTRGPTSPRDLSIPRFALRRDEAAASVGVSITKFGEWEADGRMPKGRKIDGVVLYDTQEIFDAWRRLRDGEFTSTNPFDGVTA